MEVIDLFEKCVKNSRPIQEIMESNMMMIRHLDVQCQVKENEAKQKLINLIDSWKKKSSKEEQRRDYEAVLSCFAKAKELSDRKIEISSETYELVDGFIQKLDNDTAKFNNYMQQKQLNEADANTSNVSPTDHEAKNEKQLINKKQRRTPSSTISNVRKNIAGRKRAAEEMEVGKQIVPESSSKKAEPVHGDMPVDPNEPRYCICNQVSFGHMVCCDNKNCPLEWFHFSCVGLNSSPKGKWYCPQCREDKDVKKHQRQKVPRIAVNAEDDGGNQDG